MTRKKMEQDRDTNKPHVMLADTLKISSSQLQKCTLFFSSHPTQSARVNTEFLGKHNFVSKNSG